MRRRLSRYVKLSGGVGHRLSRLPNGHLRDRLKTPYRDGSTHVVFEPLDFMVHLLCATPSGRPAAVQIVNPADLSSPGWCPPATGEPDARPQRGATEPRDRGIGYRVISPKRVFVLTHTLNPPPSR